MSAIDFDPRQLAEAARARADEADAARARLQPVTLSEFLARDIKPRENVLAPWLPERGLAMIFAWRGIGKTWISLGISHAIAAGGSFLRWRAPRPRRVLHVDGEMPQSALQERLALIVNGADSEAVDDYLLLLMADEYEGGIPCLAHRETQSTIEAHMADADVLVLDNVSTLFGSALENEADGWAPVQEWLLRLRRMGKSVVVIHHANKGGDQRGTSRREDVLDTSISLERPKDYTADQGARFVVRLRKARGVYGQDAADFEALLTATDGAVNWSMFDPEPAITSKVAALDRDGMTQRAIASSLGVPLTTVHRHLKRARKGR